MLVAVGGTFDPIHDGHHRLLKKALEIGRDGVVVGLTSEELAPKTRNISREIRGFEDRRQNLLDEMEKLDEWNRKFEVRKLNHPHGVASEDSRFDALVVSPETREGGEKINELRRERGFEPLKIVEVPHILAEDGEPISSTRIWRGEIDQHGNLTN